MASNELSRSTLLRKDRDELVAIAEAMGNKPGSRVRKAQIVDLILELAGVGEGTEAASEPAGSDSKEPTEPKRSKAPSFEEPEVSDSIDEADAGGGSSKAKSSGQGSGSGDDASSGDNASDDNGNRRRRRRRGRDNGDTDTEPINVEGYLDLRDDGYGFLRVEGARPTKRDVYISVRQVRQSGLRKGDLVTGQARPANRNEKNPALVEVDLINGGSADAARERRVFEELTPVHPHQRLVLERSDDVTSRVVDLLAPIGKGQRSLIVAPPRSGATPVLVSMIESIEANEPELNVMVLLIDDRPEEITETESRVARAEVIASPFGQPAEEHVLVADMVLERAKRAVEAGDDVVLFVDGLSRLARAYNVSSAGSGRVLAGGVEASAIYQPKRLFGAARCFEEGGSLTVVATVNDANGNRLDELLVAELIEGANAEIHLDRAIADADITPPVLVESSQTRRLAELVDSSTADQMAALRAKLTADGKLSGIEALLERIAAHKTNAEVLAG